MTRRTRRSVVGLGTAVVLVAVAALGYRWVTSSRPVTASAAVQAYRAQHHVDRSAPTPTTTPRASSGPHVGSASARTVAVRRRAAQATADPTAWWHTPPSGVYTYATTGYERATFSRNYPSQTQRIIDTSHGGYENHHIFSQEHEEWFTLAPTAHGGVMLKRRLRVTFGPVTVDETVPFNPPLLGVPYPYRLGQTWTGSFKGDTSGTYTGKTEDHRTMRIGGTDVDVFGEHLVIRLSGKNSGTVDTTLWYAPKLGLDAREDGVYDIRSQGVPGTYHTEYTLTLISTTPQR